MIWCSTVYCILVPHSLWKKCLLRFLKTSPVNDLNHYFAMEYFAGLWQTETNGFFFFFFQGMIHVNCEFELWNKRSLKWGSIVMLPFVKSFSCYLYTRFFFPILKWVVAYHDKPWSSVILRNHFNLFHCKRWNVM